MYSFDTLPEQVGQLTSMVKNLEKVVIQLSSQFSKAQEKDERFSYQELAKYLGVHPMTVYNYKKRKVIPYYQTGRTVYFLRSEIDEALSVNKKKKC